MIIQEIGGTTAFQLMNVTFSFFLFNQHLPRLPQGALPDKMTMTTMIPEVLFQRCCRRSLFRDTNGGGCRGETIQYILISHTWDALLFSTQPFQHLHRIRISVHKLRNIVKTGGYNQGDVHHLGRGELIDPGFK